MASNNDGKEAWVTFFWNIENYSYLGNKVIIQSPEFKVTSTEKTSWRFMLHPFKGTDKCSISYYLCRSNFHGLAVVEIVYDLAILAEDGSVLQINEREKMDMNGDITLGTKLLIRQENVLKMKREIFLSRDRLRLRGRLWRTDGQAVTPVTFFARTAPKVEKRNFIWNAAKFSFLGSDYKFPYVIRSEKNDYVVFFNIAVKEETKVTIRSKSLKKEPMALKFQSFIIDVNGGHTDCGKWEMALNENEKVIGTLPFTKKYLMDNKDLYLKNDVLTLYCECSWVDGNDIHRIERIDFGISSPKTTHQTTHKPYISNAVTEQMDRMVDLKEDFEYLYSKSILSDVKLRTATQTFEAHKNILAARSPVFRAMFTTDMKEKMQESVKVSDIEDDTVCRMLLYMYTNALKGLEWESAWKLYAAADMYEIVALKSKCSSFLKSDLRPNNVCDALILADMHSDVDLKKACQEYALAHEQEVFHSDEWILFTKTHSLLASETMLLKWNKL